MKIQVKRDVFNIVSRLKKIDADYFVMFNTKTKCFELHAHNQPFNTYCLSFPFQTLDQRALTHTLKTRRQNQEQLFKQMQRQNQNLLKQKQNQLLRSYYET